MKGFFVTGAGTGVGKTMVAAAVIGALGRMGLRACGMKPVESGCDGPPSDGMYLREASGTDEPIEMITPYVFRAPLAPLSAARLEGRRVDPVRILSAARGLASRHGAIVVEGVGGFLVPLAEGGYTVREMARGLGLPVIVAATPQLGTVNHTLLTVEAVRAAGLLLAGVVFNHNVPGIDPALVRSSREMVEEMTGMPLLGELPHMDGAGPGHVTSMGPDALSLDMLGKYL